MHMLSPLGVIDGQYVRRQLSRMPSPLGGSQLPRGPPHIHFAPVVDHAFAASTFFPLEGCARLSSETVLGDGLLVEVRRDVVDMCVM